jgi:ATP-dependent Clp protease protease subunit
VYLPLKAFEEDDSMEPVTLILNSSGGSVSDGFFLAYYISQYSKPLNIQVLGYACSMATVLLAAGGKNENIIRSCYPCSYVLIHDGYVALAAAESKTAADIMTFNNEIDEKIRQFFLDNTNLTAEEYDKHARHQWFLFADKMKEKNLIDKIIGVDE